MQSEQVTICTSVYRAAIALHWPQSGLPARAPEEEEWLIVQVHTPRPMSSGSRTVLTEAPEFARAQARGGGPSFACPFISFVLTSSDLQGWASVMSWLKEAKFADPGTCTPTSSRQTSIVPKVSDDNGKGSVTSTCHGGSR